MSDLYRLMVCVFLLGGVALVGCVSTDTGNTLTLAMAPTPADLAPAVEQASVGDPAQADAGAMDMAPEMVLPDSVAVLPAPALARADEAALSPPDSMADAVADMAAVLPAEPVTTRKQGRLGLRLGQPAMPLVSRPVTPDPEPELVALAEESAPAKKSLAQSALALVTFTKPDAPKSNLDRLIVKYADLYDVPVALVRRVVKRESNFRPAATNGGHYGLMQIKHATARSMGYKGSARGLLDAETNLKYAVKYLRGAFLVAGGNHDRADRLYQSGYYYDAKRKGLLDETGLGKDRRRRG